MLTRLRNWLSSVRATDPCRVSRYDTALGTYYVPALRTDVIAGAIRSGKIFEPEIVELARKYCSPGSVVLDVGANFGQMSILFAGMVGPTGHVFAFEADPFVASILKRNLDANNCTNVTAVPGAVYDRSGEQIAFPEPDFVQFGSFGSYGLDPQTRSGRHVPTIRIDDVPMPGPVSFMKIDVQGSDLAALRGAEATINQHRMPIVFEFESQFQERFGTCFDDYSRFIDSIDYRITDVIYGMNYVIVPR